MILGLQKYEQERMFKKVDFNISQRYLYKINHTLNRNEMIRLHDFITKIRNCKTIAEERAQYQKEMAAIRESFAKNEENLRPRNLTKLLFINMSGQDTNFGQMECLNLITGKSPIQKRIGYLGLTQLFHEKSELLMMSTNRIKVDLVSTNTNVIGLALCVVSEVCTVELAKELQGEIMKCMENKSNYIKKKAILTSIKLIKKAPEMIPDYLPKVIDSIETKNHGVLLSCLAFLENVILIDSNYANEVGSLAAKLYKIYKFISTESNSDYNIGGVQDPFLQVAILRLMKTLKRYLNGQEFNSYLMDIVIAVSDCMSGASLGSSKSGPKAILYECFQCSVLLDPTNKLKRIVDDMLTKFISTKDANSKYLSLVNLSLMSKYDLAIAKNYKGVIIQCLSQADILIQTMALDLLYLIAGPENSPGITKELLNILLSATDEQFISELALHVQQENIQICLIVEKHSESRRWQFDTILKVLVLADQTVKEDASKSLVHLILSTPQLQKYCLTKLFFTSSENTQNDALSRITLYILGELGHMLPRISQVQVTEQTILNLFEQIIFRPTVQFDTISYGLSALMKLYDKFPGRHEQIVNMLKAFESHCDLEVQKRACQYLKLLDRSWDQDRRKEVNIPVPSYRASAEAFSSIPIGDTTLELDTSSLKMPQKMNINYSEMKTDASHLKEHQREVIVTHGNHFEEMPKETVQHIQKPAEVKTQKKVTSLLDDDDDEGPANVAKPVVEEKKIVSNDDPFGILGLDVGGNQPNNVPPPPAEKTQFGGLDLLGGFGGSQNPAPVNTGKQSTNSGNLLGDDFLGGGMGQVPPPPAQTGFQNPGENLFNPVQVSQPPPPQPPIQPEIVQPQTYKFKGFQNDHIQLWYDARKESASQTFIKVSFMNKTPSYIDGISIQTAVMKYLKIMINPLNNNALPASSKGGVHQTMTITNSAQGEKPIVMKIKLAYVINGQKIAAESKIEGFPLGF